MQEKLDPVSPFQPQMLTNGLRDRRLTFDGDRRLHGDLHYNSANVIPYLTPSVKEERSLLLLLLKTLDADIVPTSKTGTWCHYGSPDGRNSLIRLHFGHLALPFRTNSGGRTAMSLISKSARVLANHGATRDGTQV